MKTINIKRNFPTVERAVAILRAELSSLRLSSERTVKIVHGYGSTGMGGSIKIAVHQYLRQAKSRGEIQAWLPGEKFSRNFNDAQLLLNTFPSLKNDIDYARGNDGVTIVVLKSYVRRVRN